MTKTFWLLLITNLRLTFNPQKLFNRSSKPSSKGKSALYVLFMLFLFGYFIGLSGLFYYSIGDAVSQVGLLDLLIYLALTVYTVLILVLTLFSANGYLFKSRDLELMLSLPVSHFTVLSVKFFLQYVYELIFAAFILAPAFYFYFYFSSFTTVGIILAVICFFIAPLIPMSIGSLLSYFIGLLTRRLRKKNIFTIVLSLTFVIGWVALSRNSAGIVEYIMNNAVHLKDAISKYYLPAGWLIGALNGDILEFLFFALANFAVMLLIFFIISRKYSDIITILNTSGVRKKVKLDKLGQQSNSALGAMIRKELSMYFSSANYVLNTWIGSLILLIASVSLMFLDISTIFTGIDGGALQETGLIIAAAITIYMPSVNPTTSATISLEGKRLWIYKSIPADTRDILKAKTAVNMIMHVPIILIADILMSIRFQLSIIDFLLLAAIGITFILLFSLTGIMINLAKPKLDYENEIIVIKQSMSIFLQTMLEMVVFLALGLVYAFSGITNFYLYAISVLIVVWAVIALLVYKLFSWGVQRFNQLN